MYPKVFFSRSCGVLDFAHARHIEMGLRSPNDVLDRNVFVLLRRLARSCSVALEFERPLLPPAVKGKTNISTSWQQYHTLWLKASGRNDGMEVYSCFTPDRRLFERTHRDDDDGERARFSSGPPGGQRRGLLHGNPIRQGARGRAAVPEARAHETLEQHTRRHAAGPGLHADSCR